MPQQVIEWINLRARRFVLPLLKRFNRDVSIIHHWTGDRIQVRLYEDKGYWFHGRRREFDEMSTLARLLHRGDTVIEVGGHIGYLSLYFSHLVGSDGSVVVFEPSDANRRLLQLNVASARNVRISQLAVSNRSGESVFYVDNLTGQNNSLVRAFEGLAANVSNAPGVEVVTTEVTVKTSTLDQELNSIHGHLLKIDVEGHELEVLEGGVNWLARTKPFIMLEVQRNHSEVFRILTDLGYVIFDARLVRFLEVPLCGTHDVFAIPRLKVDSLASL